MKSALLAMPPIRNHILYAWRVVGKWLSFLVFGLGTVLLVLLVFPCLRLILHRQRQFQKYGHWIISWCFRVFIGFMFALGVIKLKTENRAAFSRLEGKIIIANHPSLLDVVMLISLIPNADCVVNAALLRNIVRGVVRQLYIPNSLDFEDLSAQCLESLSRGDCLIIFPEGTRTPRSGGIGVKKGAARIAVLSGKAIVPVRIGGNDKWGLGKKDPWWAFNHRERYIYELEMLREISPEQYAAFPYAIAVKRMTEDIKAVLFDPEERERIV